MSTQQRAETEYGTSKGLFGETDRESGEYHFRNGYTQQVYSNAHFVPVEESTSTPKYYRPAEKSSDRSGDRTAAGRRVQQKKAKRSSFAGVLLLCLLSGMLGGVLGAYLTVRFWQAEPAMSSEASEEIHTLSEQAAFAEEDEAAPETVRNPEESLPTPSEIYDLACSQAVSVAVEIVSYDYYGNQIPSVISGSGFVISEDGYILTNYHVVEKAVEGGLNVTITTYDGSVSVGRIVGAAEDEDLAIIKIEKNGFTPVSFGNSEELSVGDTVYTVGNPYGMLEFTMTMGHVSALNRTIATEETENARRMFQIDAAVYSGNSGGPVYNSLGEVVGIVTAKYNSSGMEGIGFAMPISEVLPAVNELVDKGYVSGKASLGVSFDSRYNTVYSRYYRLPEGAFVSSVSSGSCADRAGIQPGDILIQIGDWAVSDYESVPQVLRHFSAGETAQLRFYRDGQILTATATFDEAIPSVAQSASSL